MADLKSVKPRRKDERTFDRLMRQGYLVPFLDGLARRVSQHPNLGTIGIIGVIHDFVLQWNRNENVRFPVRIAEGWASRLDDYHKAAFINDFRRALKVDVRPLLNSAQIQPILREAVNDSVSLIKTIPSRFHTRIANRYMAEEAAAPLDQQARARIFRDEGKSSGYNLRRITRDQSNKLTGRLTEARQQMVGIDEYTWDTSEDDRVRPNHAVKQDVTFRWDQPPPDTGHPGHDIQCRCVAIPKVVADELRQRTRR